MRAGFRMDVDFGVREDNIGRWRVVRTITGRTLLVFGVLMVGLDEESADRLAARLNRGAHTLRDAGQSPLRH